MKATGFLVGLLLLGSSPHGVESAPFAAVVPKEIQIDTAPPAFKVSFMFWGWIAATGGTLTEQDLSEAVLTVSIDNPQVSITQSPFENLSSFAPLDSGEVAGLRLDPGNAVYDTLLQTGESLKNGSLGLFETTIDFSKLDNDTSLVTSLVTATITLAGEELSYFTTVAFDSLGLQRPQVVEGQRVVSVPIPSPVQPATWGSLKRRYGGPSSRR